MSNQHGETPIKEHTSVFMEIVQTENDYVNAIIGVEGEIANYVSNMTEIMQSNLKEFEKIVDSDLHHANIHANKNKFNSTQAARAQFWSSKMSSDGNLASYMKDGFNADNQAAGQVLSKFGQDQQTLVQEGTQGIGPEQEVSTLLSSSY